MDGIITHNYEIEYYSSSDFDAIEKLFSEDEKELLNPNDIYEVKLKGKKYYHIKDLEDGDFIGIDKEKRIFKITHNPLEIIELKGELTEILKW